MENVTRLFDLLTRCEINFPKENALGVKRNGKWDIVSTKTYREMANYFSYGLLALGFKKGDKLATVSNNRIEWNYADMGMHQIGVVHVPVYPTIGPIEYEYILKHSEAKILIISSKERYDLIKPIADKVPSIDKVYTFNKFDNVPNFDDIIELGKQNEEKFKTVVEEGKQFIDKHDVSSIIYTSGTTGMPKGVMLTHWNFLSNVIAVKDVPNLNQTHKALSFLPLCHVFERVVNYIYQYLGVSIYYAESVETISENLKEIKPHVFVSVPRVLEKVYDKIIAKGNDLKGIKRGMFFRALELAEQFEFKGKSLIYTSQLNIFRQVVFSKWREALGGNVLLIISGGAALQARLSRIFYAAGITVLEGYGLTETSPVIAVNRLYQPYHRFGWVGQLLDNVEVKIADDGEILFKGPNLMKGYYKDEEKTAEVIDSEGWFHTGDIGELDELKMLRITDRKKEIFKLSTGKYVAPQAVENRLKQSIFIENAMVVGADEKYAAALLCPNFEHLHDWCAIHKIFYRDNIELIRHPKIVARFQREIDEANHDLGKHEQIKKFELVCENWTSNTGELSAKLSLKRKFIVEKYRVKLDRLYEKTKEEGLVGERIVYEMPINAR